MAILIINEKTYEIEDGSSISGPCQQEGLPFSCNTGVCGVCQIRVLEGAENLNELTEEEKDFGLSPNMRLGCLCFIKRGTVKISF